MTDKLVDTYRVLRDASVVGFTDRGVPVVGFRLVPEPDGPDMLLEEYGAVGGECAPIMPQEPLSDGDLVRVRLTNVSRDWETGHVDGYDLVLEKVEEEVNTEAACPECGHVEQAPGVISKEGWMYFCSECQHKWTLLVAVPPPGMSCDD